MNKPIISLALLAFAGAAAIAAGCSAPDPGVEYLGPRHLDGLVGGSATTPGTGNPGGGGQSNEDAGAGAVGTTGGGDGGTAAATGDGGTTATTDAGGTGGATFLGEATLFANVPPAQTAAQAHQGAGQAVQTPTLDCMASCHAAGGAGGQFLFAGFMATAANGTTGAAGVEVRAYNGTAGFSAYTDTNGYFWMLPPVTLPTGPFNMGARNATTTNLMPAAQTTIDCQNSGCHGGGNPIHVP
jgi:hypothetical protein